MRNVSPKIFILLPWHVVPLRCWDRMQFSPSPKGVLYSSSVPTPSHPAQPRQPSYSHGFSSACLSGRESSHSLAAQAAQHTAMSSSPPADRARCAIRVPREAVGFIIGRRGETVRSLSTRSGAHIAVEEDNKDHHDEGVFNITGTQEQIQRARELISEKVNAVLSTRLTL
eukprot:IDg7293t1